MSSADCGGWEESTRAAACKEEGGGGGGGRVGGDGRRCLDSRQTPQQSLDGWLTPQPRPAGARLGPNLNPVSLSDYSNFPSFPTLPPLPLIHAASSRTTKVYADGWHSSRLEWTNSFLERLRGFCNAAIITTSTGLHSILKLDACFFDEHMFESNRWADIFWKVQPQNWRLGALSCISVAPRCWETEVWLRLNPPSVWLGRGGQRLEICPNYTDNWLGLWDPGRGWGAGESVTRA